MLAVRSIRSTCLVALACLLTFGVPCRLFADEYYTVERGSNRLNYVRPGDPSKVAAKEWQVWVCRKGMQPSDGSRWGMLVGSSAKDVMDQLRRNQESAAGCARMLGRTPGDSWTADYLNYLGPIAVLDDASRSHADPLTLRTAAESLLLAYNNWKKFQKAQSDIYNALNGLDPALRKDAMRGFFKEYFGENDRSPLEDYARRIEKLTRDAAAVGIMQSHVMDKANETIRQDIAAINLSLTKFETAASRVGASESAPVVPAAPVPVATPANGSVASEIAAIKQLAADDYFRRALTAHGNPAAYENAITGVKLEGTTVTLTQNDGQKSNYNHRFDLNNVQEVRGRTIGTASDSAANVDYLVISVNRSDQITDDQGRTASSIIVSCTPQNSTELVTHLRNAVSAARASGVVARPVPVTSTPASVRVLPAATAVSLKQAVATLANTSTHPIMGLSDFTLVPASMRRALIEQTEKEEKNFKTHLVVHAETAQNTGKNQKQLLLHITAPYAPGNPGANQLRLVNLSTTWSFTKGKWIIVNAQPLRTANGGATTGTQPVAPSPTKAPVAAEVTTTRFFFSYQNNPNDRHDVVETLKGDWLEVLSDNQINLFHSVGRETVDGNLGTVLQNNANDQYYWFVADGSARGTYPNYIRQRTGANGTWGIFQQMHISGYQDKMATTRFYFNYLGNPNDRHDVVQTLKGDWFELFPNHNARVFHTVGKDTVEGNFGTVIQAADWDQFYLFIPDSDASGTYRRQMWQRTGANGTWGLFQVMLP